MRAFLLAAATLPVGLLVAAPAARADDFDLGVLLRGRRGAVALDVRVGDRGRGRDAHEHVGPVLHRPAPMPYVAGPEAFRAFVPAHVVVREETICEPAVYEDRRVPVWGERFVPVIETREEAVYEDVLVPVYEDRAVPEFALRFDVRRGVSVRVRVGERVERVQVGTRVERVRTGTRSVAVEVGRRAERVVVGERVEHVLVRAERCRVVERREWVAARSVWVTDDPRVRARIAGEVLSSAAFAAENAAAMRAGSYPVARR